MYSIEELADDFHRLGIRPSDTVMLHASVRSGSNNRRSFLIFVPVDRLDVKNAVSG
jgi:hypothetical protein